MVVCPFNVTLPPKLATCYTTRREAGRLNGWRDEYSAIISNPPSTTSKQESAEVLSIILLLHCMKEIYFFFLVATQLLYTDKQQKYKKYLKI